MQLIFVVNSNLSESEYNNFFTFEGDFGQKCRFVKMMEIPYETQQSFVRHICDN